MFAHDINRERDAQFRGALVGRNLAYPDSGMPACGVVSVGQPSKGRRTPMHGTRAVEPIRERWALRLWSAKQVRNRVTYRLWYVKHVLTGEPELRFVASLCDRDRWTIDIGANRGMYAAAALPFSKGVIAFEPQSHLAALMRKCLPRSVEIRECAVSHTSGPVELVVPADPRFHAEARVVRDAAGGGRPSDHVVQSVSAVRLDDVIDRPVGLIKIDVEGHELAVLQGA